jgi:glycerate-2-kinase
MFQGRVSGEVSNSSPAEVQVQLSPVGLPAALVAGGWAVLHLDILGKSGDTAKFSLEKMKKNLRKNLIFNYI